MAVKYFCDRCSDVVHQVKLQRLDLGRLLNHSNPSSFTRVATMELCERCEIKVIEQFKEVLPLAAEK